MILHIFANIAFFHQNYFLIDYGLMNEIIKAVGLYVDIDQTK